MNETEISAQIADGLLSSPVEVGGFTLFALRVTGTGTVWREAHQETAYRSPEHYLTPAMMERVQGLPVIVDHPAASALDGEEFDQRVIGTCTLPYIATSDGVASPDGTELWTIARIYSKPAIEAMTTTQLSTSPAVAWHKDDMGETADMPDGSKIFIENAPVILDHLAVCELGVFDRGGPPMGVRL